MRRSAKVNVTGLLQSLYEITINDLKEAAGESCHMPVKFESPFISHVLINLGYGTVIPNEEQIARCEKAFREEIFQPGLTIERVFPRQANKTRVTRNPSIRGATKDNSRGWRVGVEYTYMSCGSIALQGLS